MIPGNLTCMLRDGELDMTRFLSVRGGQLDMTSFVPPSGGELDMTYCVSPAAERGSQHYSSS